MVVEFVIKTVIQMIKSNSRRYHGYSFFMVYETTLTSSVSVPNFAVI